MRIIALFLFLTCTQNAYADIAFVANTDGNWDLFSANDDGKNPVQLTTTPYDEKTPCWSPDRKNIVYATSDGHINIINIVSGKTNRIAAEQNTTPKITPAFSPDGKKIAYVQFIPGRDFPLSEIGCAGADHYRYPHHPQCGYHGEHFFGPKNSGGTEARIRTIVNRKSLPAGSHTIYWNTGKTSHFVEIDTTGLNIVNPRPDTYLHPNNNPLDLTGRIIRVGKTVA